MCVVCVGVICGDVCMQCMHSVWYMYMGGGVVCACVREGEGEVPSPRLRITDLEKAFNLSLPVRVGLAGKT